METRASHVLIGAFTLAVLALAMLFALWIGKSTLDREWAWYRIVFTEAVTGLTVGGAVQYNGIQVGEVRRLSLDPLDPSRVYADVRVSAGTPVKTDTVAKLTFTGLTGVALIQLSGGSPGAARLTAGDDGEPPTIIAQESALQRLLANSEDITTTASDILYRVNRLLNDENLARVSGTLDHIEQATLALSDSKDEIRALLTEGAAAGRQLRETLVRAERAVQRIDGTVAKIDRGVADELPQIVDRLQRALANVERMTANADAMLAENRAALQAFSQEGLGQAGPTLEELRGLIRDLGRLSNKLEEDPTGYLLGRRPEPEFDP